MSADFLATLKIFPRADLDDIASVAIVREAVFRIVNLFRYHLQTQTVHPTTSLEDFLAQVEILNYRHSRLRLDSLLGLNQTLPQMKWLKPTRWAEPRILLRLENLTQHITVQV